MELRPPLSTGKKHGEAYLLTSKDSFPQLHLQKRVLSKHYSTVPNTSVPLNEHLDDEIQFITATVIKNGYPELFIQRHSKSTSDDKIEGPKKLDCIFQIPFLGDDNFNKVYTNISSALTEPFSQVNLVLDSANNKVWNTQLKDETNKTYKSNLVYKFSCVCV